MKLILGASISYNSQSINLSQETTIEILHTANSHRLTECGLIICNKRQNRANVDLCIWILVFYIYTDELHK
jgi:hypothetical protein